MENISISLDKRSRPIRFGFLLKGFSDPVALNSAVQINTALWGGRYNPIIPVLRRKPNWWRDTSLTGPDITQKYLAAFEPDYVLADNPQLFETLDFPADRQMTLGDFTNADETLFTHGIPVMELYRHLYEDRYRFEQRHPADAIIPNPDPTAAPRLVTTALGQVSKEDFSPVREAFSFVFDATETTVTSDNFYDILTGRTLAPLQTGSFEFRVRRLGKGHSSWPTFFLMSGTSTRDLVDYWNLRAFGLRILPVPIDWISEARSQLTSFITTSAEMRSENADSPFTFKLICSRTVNAEQAVTQFTDEVNYEDSWSPIVQRWYPRFWRTNPQPVQDYRRCIVRVETESSDHTLDDSLQVSFESPGIPFDLRMGVHLQATWANVVRVRDYSTTLDVASVYPAGLGSARNILGRIGTSPIWFSNEGITYSGQTALSTERWRLPTGTKVFNALFEQHDFDTRLSPAGKLAREATNRLGGLAGLSVLQNGELLSLLDKMAAGQNVVELTPRPEGGRSLPSARGRIAHRQEVVGVLMKAYDNNEVKADAALRQLTDSRVIQLGLMVDCDHCDHSNWISLNELAEDINCERCLEIFAFPTDSPPRQQWAYRTIGPFAVENFMQGSYSVLLSALTLTQVELSKKVSWTPSLICEKQGLREHEIDFGLLTKGDVIPGDQPTMVLGECKSYQEVSAKDIETALTMRRYFPDALFCFGYLKEDLAQDEKDRLREFVVSGWHDQLQQPQAIILTGRELLHSRPIPHCWQDLDANDNDIVDQHITDLESLANATQKLYLDLDGQSFMNEVR